MCDYMYAFFLCISDYISPPIQNAQNTQKLVQGLTSKPPCSLAQSCEEHVKTEMEKADADVSPCISISS